MHDVSHFAENMCLLNYLENPIVRVKVQTVEEQVRAAAEHKLGVANQSITAGFFDNNTR